MAPAWVVAQAGSPPWAGKLPLKLDPTTGGGNAFWGTDSGCQCTRRGRAAKSWPSGGIFFWVCFGSWLWLCAVLPHLGSRNPFFYHGVPSFAGVAGVAVWHFWNFGKVPYGNASHAGKRPNTVSEERIPTPQMGENRA